MLSPGYLLWFCQSLVWAQWPSHAMYQLFLWQMGKRCVCVLANLEYLSLLFCAVFWAAAPGLVAVLPMWDSAYVFGTVTSKAIGFPLAHGRRVVPSGRLLSSRIRLIGSVTAGVRARLIALHRMSFQWLWCCCLGALLRQDSPCSPRASTALPHTRVWFTGFRAQPVGHCYPDGLVW